MSGPNSYIGHAIGVAVDYEWVILYAGDCLVGSQTAGVVESNSD